MKNEANIVTEIVYGHSDILAELKGDVSIGDRSVTGEIPLVSEALHPAEALLRAQSDALSKGSTEPIDPCWSESIGVLEKSPELSGMALAKSIEVVKVNGQKQVHYFDASGELVDVRILSKVS